MSDGCVIERSMLLWAKATWMGGMEDLRGAGRGGYDCFRVSLGQYVRGQGLS